MPSDFRYSDDSDVYVTVDWGSVSIVDLSGATWTGTPPRRLHEELARLRPAFAPPKIPTASVTPADFFHGIASAAESWARDRTNAGS